MVDHGASGVNGRVFINLPGPERYCENGNSRSSTAGRCLYGVSEDLRWMDTNESLDHSARISTCLTFPIWTDSKLVCAKRGWNELFYSQVHSLLGRVQTFWH